MSEEATITRPTLEKAGVNVLNVRMDDVRDGWEQWFLLSSDRHHDSPACDRALITEHLDLARQRGAMVLDFGDLFDAMQGKYDPRRNYPEMRPEYLRRMQDERMGYLDVIVKDAIEFYAPYADLMGLVAVGNHESAVAKHNDTHLTDRLVYGLRSSAGSNVVMGAYGGWVVFHFTVGGSMRKSYRLKYFHGSGGGGVVTKGVLRVGRQAAYLPDADIIVGGHIHENWLMSLPRERISDGGKIYSDMQYHVQTPTYKDDYLDGSGGWHVERGMPPKPRGCVWLRFWYERRDVRMQFVSDVR